MSMKRQFRDMKSELSCLTSLDKGVKLDDFSYI